VNGLDINSINSAISLSAAASKSKLTETEKKYDADSNSVLSAKEKAAMLTAETQNISKQLTQDTVEISNEAQRLYNANA
jgi:hypothetical protein